MDLHTEVIGYVGRQHKGGYAGYDADVSTFLILETASGAADAAEMLSGNMLKYFPDKIGSDGVSIEEAVSGELAASKFDNVMGIAVGVYLDGNLHLRTLGTGSVYVMRNGAASLLISGDHTAVGKPQENDIFYFTNDAFIEAIGDEAQFLSLIKSADIQNVFASIPHAIKNPQLTGAVLLSVRFIRPPAVAAGVAPQTQSADAEPKPPVEQMRVSIGKKRKLITLVGVFIVAAILIWSVVLGYKRRSEESAKKLIAATRSAVEEKLARAADEAFLNPQSAVKLIEESYAEYNTLRTKVGDYGAGELSDFYNSIKNKENEITHKEERQADEFYDLSLDTKGASGAKMSLMDQSLTVLDKSRGAIYVISVEKKSLDVLVDESMKSAALVSGYDGDIYYFIPDKGLYVLKNNKAENIIAYDPEWGRITDIAFFNGNVYLLDQQSHQLHKYTAVESGFSTKKGYFAADSIRLTDSPSLAIDSSVYIGFGQQISKFTGGSRDEFPAELPDTEARIDKILTTPNLDRVFAWDKKKGALYVFTKEGAFDRQIESSKFSQASDVVVYASKAYLLIKEKIYAIDVR